MRCLQRACAGLFLVLALASSAAAQESTLVFAAASLGDAIAAVNAAWKQRGGRTVVSLASSSTLARQIENGAPAQVFISADLEWMDYVATRGLLESGTRRNLLGNRLVLIAPAGSRVQVSIPPGSGLADALGANGRLALGDPRHVPAGKYAKAALTALGTWDTIAPRIAAAENVRAALALVARGEAPLGIVYETDARAEPGVRIVATFPEDLHPKIVYPAALIKGAGPAAAAYLTFLASAEAQALFMRHGFRPLH